MALEYTTTHPVFMGGDRTVRRSGTPAIGRSDPAR